MSLPFEDIPLHHRKGMRKDEIQDIYKLYQNSRERALSCEKCDLHKTRQNVVWGEGYWFSDVIVIGEAPGQAEDESGSPFVGRSGKLVRETLGAVGFDVSKIAIYNTLMCRPPENANPTQKQMDACKGWLKVKLNCAKPKMLISVGAYATAWVLGKEPKSIRITKISGTKVQPDLMTTKIRHPVFPLVHPAFVLRGGISRADYAIQAIQAAVYAEQNKLVGVG